MSNSKERAKRQKAMIYTADPSMELEYEGKESEKALLNHLPILPLTQVKSFGKIWHDIWQNMLIYGDSLATLRSLAQNPGIKEKVRLVYIDPPFSTSQDFRVDLERASTISRASSGQLGIQR